MDDFTTNNPVVSIIVNCRNGAAFLRECLDSIYAQNYSNWEIIFWDNISTDGSAAIAQSYDARLRYFKSAEDTTLGRARNMAIAKARGRYLAFLDCDDKWLPHKLEKQVRTLESNPDVDFIYGNYFRLVMPKTHCLILGLKGSQPEGNVFGNFLCHYPVNLQTVMVRKDAIDRLNLKFDDRFEVSEEFDLFMRLLLKSKALYINEPVAVYRIHEGMSSQKLIHKYPIEAELILSKLRNIDSAIARKYLFEIKYFEAKIGYWNAKVAMECKDVRSARSRLSPFKFVDMNFFILYFLTFFPSSIWQWVHRCKIEGHLS